MANETIDQSKVKLPGPFQELLDQFKSDRKKLMNEPAFAKPDQLRQFLGLYLIPRIEKAIFLLGGGLAETYDISVSNLKESGLLRSFVIKQLRAQGVEIPPEMEQQLPDVVEDLVDQIDQTLFKLASLLGEKLPKDKETEETFNGLRELFDDLVDELLGADPEKDDDEKDGDGDEKKPEADAAPSDGGSDDEGDGAQGS
jgi:hypothetical protein